jgi:predicted ATPase/DNA-binding winged helix-turn-helix (wHTH) protein
MPAPTLLFPPFRLDPANACLWRGAKRLVLPPKDFAVLHHLVSHAGQLATHAELLKAVWPDTVVSAKGLKVFVRRLRQQLGDNAAKPRFIETVHGQGYRFLPIVTTQPVQNSSFKVPRSEPQPSALSSQRSVLVGRETELAQMHSWLNKAADGRRQIVFVTGEPGIGKTALVEAFLRGARHWKLGSGASPPQSLAPESQLLNPGAWVARGQCIEQYGSGEPYMPVLESLGRLAHTPDGDYLKRVLAQYAPTWLAQLPALLNPADVEALQRRVLGATRDRMLREIAEALEVLTAERTLVLVLEDLHWADASTMELFAMLARRRESARLLMIGTYRPAEMLDDGHPLSSMLHELRAHDLCSELALRLLSEEEVASYLGGRFPRGVFPTRLVEVLHRRTEGNPLFVVSVIDDLVKQGMMLQVDEGWVFQGEMERLATEVPESIRHLVARQRERLQPEEQRVLEAASVVGMEFSVAAIAAALEAEVIVVGERCARLSERQQFLRPAGITEWPDGTVAARYGFTHALYQHLWNERVSIEKQRRWHLRVGERKETAYGERAGEIATELAVHFEQGRDYPRAIRYLQQAGENALRRSANVEAISHLSKGLELLPTLPDTPERTRQELTLQITLGVPLTATKGFAAPEVERTYAQARQLCRQVGETPQLFPALHGLCGFYLVRGEIQTGRELTEQLLFLAQRAQDPALLLEAHAAAGVALSFVGEFAPARAHLEQSLTLYDSRQHRSHAFLYGSDTKVMCLSFAAWVLWSLGYPDRALKRSYEALALARELSHPHSLAWALNFACRLHQFRREGRLTRERAETLIALSLEHGFPFWLAAGTGLRDWALSEQGQGKDRATQLRQGMAAGRATAAEARRPYWLTLRAEAYGKAGRPEEGLPLLGEALAVIEKTRERFYEAEQYRLKGELLLAQEDKDESQNSKSKSQKSKFFLSPQHLAPGTRTEAEAYFCKAIEIARQQQAKSFELRAVMSLVRLRQRQAQAHVIRNTQHGSRTILAETHTMLSEIYGWFTEGFDTKDLQEAKILLEELGYESRRH